MAICEAYYREGMEAEELGHKLHQIITAASDRDMYSGWGAVVYLVTKDGISTTFHKTKQTWSCIAIMVYPTYHFLSYKLKYFHN